MKRVAALVLCFLMIVALTACGSSGSRAESTMHYQVAEDHGFTEIADFIVMDENGSMIIPVGQHPID